VAHALLLAWLIKPTQFSGENVTEIQTLSPKMKPFEFQKFTLDFFVSYRIQL